MKTVTATFKIVTPMFLGDANHEVSSIRTPSIKGALRFWWRALNWKNAIEKYPDNEDAALKWLHDEEARLFGSAAEEKKKGGQGVFLLSISPNNILQFYRKESNPFDKKYGIHYLLGQGLWHFKKNLQRTAFKENQVFSLAMIFKPNTSKEDIHSIIKALILFGYLGALGSRARHGFGSIQLESLKSSEDITLPFQISKIKNIQEYTKVLHQLLSDFDNKNQPPLTAFSANSTVQIIDEGNCVTNVLNHIGEELQLYRSWGRNGKVNGKIAEQNFKDDHDNVQTLNLDAPPKRSAFGLPHNYFFSSNNEQIEINAYFGRNEARRASPLFLHIHQINEKSYIGVHTFLPSLFLPDEAQIVVKNKKNNQTVSLPPQIDYGVITTYLKRFKNATRII